MWTKIGDVDVDAGLIMIGDPCYTAPEDGSSAVSSWEEFLAKLWAAEGKRHPGVSQPFEHQGAAVVVNTLYGDGTYPVYAEFDKGGIKRVMIDFDCSDDD